MIRSRAFQLFPGTASSFSSPQLFCIRRFSSSSADGSAAAATAAGKKEGKKEGFLTAEKKEKLMIGAIAAGITATTTLGVCHLLVAPVKAEILAGSVLGSALTGACAAFEGSESGGAGFGVLIGLFLGGMGAYFAKNEEAPWSGKTKK